MHQLRILIFIAFSLFLVWWFGRPLAEVVRRRDRLDSVREDVASLREEKSELERRVEYYKSEAYVEEEARNRLNLSKEGEKIVVLPQSVREKMKDAATPKEANTPPPWRQWYSLFFE